MARKEEEVDLEALADRMEQVEKAMDRLREPYSELVGYIDRLQEISRSYVRLLDLLQRYGSLSPDMAIPELKDALSREIVNVLFEKGGRNISQITEALRAKRGTASRRIVRERLKALEAKGIVHRSGDPRGTAYDVTEETVRRWSKVLGLVAPGPEEEPR